MIINERIKELRKEAGITQEELAKKTGLTRSAIAQYESRNVEPTASAIIKLADYFNVCADYLLGRHDYY
jgi:transcriptional regulator with XRE-family HTH domain